jgi:RNA polymerase sigma factor (TIGR02999 family)
MDARTAAPGVTQLLADWQAGSDDAARKIIVLMHGELRRLAAKHLRRELDCITLQPTALVNELCANLLSRQPLSCENRLHFLYIASQQMRRVIVDEARRRRGPKRGGPLPRLPLDEALNHSIPLDHRIVGVHEALDRLEKLDARSAAVVEMRFFGGLTEDEIGDALGLSVATVKRDWEFARCWLLAQLSGG